ncbi:YceI family protein [Dokdonella sp.]|uniref:YceI family protein n=1 Tax=Dokdonella sp. TaxID=2291710 RepID=UPI003C5E3ADA
MKSRILLLLSLACCGMANAADYTVKDGSTLEFYATFQGEEFQGRFMQFVANIQYDPTRLGDSKFDVSVDLSSARTGDSERDAMLPDQEFFDVAAHPKARFVTSQFRQSADKVFADGTLSLKGISKPVELQVKFTPNATGGILEVETILNRLEYQVGIGDYADTSTIGDAVRVRGHLLLESN